MLIKIDHFKLIKKRLLRGLFLFPAILNFYFKILYYKRSVTLDFPNKFPLPVWIRQHQIKCYKHTMLNNVKI